MYVFMLLLFTHKQHTHIIQEMLSYEHDEIDEVILKADIRKFLIPLRHGPMRIRKFCVLPVVFQCGVMRVAVFAGATLEPFAIHKCNHSNWPWQKS